MNYALTALNRVRAREQGLIKVEGPVVPKPRTTIEGHPACPRCMRPKKQLPDGTYASLCEYHLDDYRRRQVKLNYRRRQEKLRKPKPFNPKDPYRCYKWMRKEEKELLQYNQLMGIG